MSFIVTASGDELSMSQPAPGHVTLYSIAWSLAQINRFNGHAIRPYSVAEHSLLVAEICEREFALPVSGVLAGLMHDAHEAYCGDMHSPGKAAIGPAWRAWEDGWLQLVRRCFAVAGPSQRHAGAIARADLIALATERQALMHPAPTPWPALAGVEPVAWVDLMAPERRAMDWESWRDCFMDRYHELDYARNDALFAANGR